MIRNYSSILIKGCSACSSICLYLLIDKYSSNHYLSIILSSDRVNSNNVESRKKLSSFDYYRCPPFKGDTRQYFIGDPRQHFLVDPHFSIVDPHFFIVDPHFFIGDPHFSSQTLKCSHFFIGGLHFFIYRETPGSFRRKKGFKFKKLTASDQCLVMLL